MDRLSTSKRIVRAIIRDLEGRCGLGNEWGELDERLKTGVTADWCSIVYAILTEYDGPYLGQN